MPLADPHHAGAARSVLAGGGEMGALMRELDWSRTPVGPSDAWPQSLCTAVSIVLESKFGMMIAWGPEFIQFYNDPFRPILGATKHPACGKSARETFPEAWHIIGPLFDQVMQGHSVGFEDMLVPLDRNGYLEECYFVYSYSPIRDESGGVGGIHVTVNETTARVIAERRLRTLRDLASLAARTSGELDAWAGAGKVLAASPADLPFAALYAVDTSGSAARLVAFHGDRALMPAELPLTTAGVWPLDARAAAGELVVLNDVRERFGERVGSAWPEPVRQAVVLRLTRPGLPQPYGFLVTGVSPRRALDGSYRDFFLLVADQISTAIANFRAFQEERQRAESLAALDRQKTAFFSSISHEFRTPLTLLLAPLEDALGREPLALGGSELQLVHRHARRLLRLVNTLLDFSRIEAGRAHARFLPVDLSALTAAVASNFTFLVAQAGLTLQLNCAALPEPTYVDAEMWEKIVLNLISNAFKFTWAGAIEVSVAALGGRAVLCVADTGTGIPEAELPHLFERFHRVEGARGRSYEGSGIGLALVQELVSMHGGQIQVESRVGAGSRFTVSIPFGASHLPPEQVGESVPLAVSSGAAGAYVEEARAWTPNSAAQEQPSAARARRHGSILLAEDNPDMRDYVQRLLAAEGWAVEAVADGQAALEAAQRRAPDLVLTDVMMPRLDGFGLLRALKEQPATRHVPVILLSARAGNEATVEGLTLGADDYVVKPFSSQELVSRVAARVEVSRARSAAARALEQLQAADQRKDEFLATLAHELRNPMSAISSALALLEQRGSDPDSAARYRQIARRQMTNLERLVDDLLDVARITRGTVELRKSGVDVAVIVQHAVASALPAIEAREHLLDVRLEPGSFPMQADATRLEQVIVNLLINAAKYTEPGGKIAVELRRELGDAAGHAVVSVRDNGRGIPRAMLDHVFDLFTQVAPTLDRRTGGLGLGLTLCKHLTEMHGGSISAASGGPGQGSEFRLRLPLTTALEVAEPSGPLSATPAVRQHRILIVEDSEDAREMLKEYLQSLGHEVHVAANGAEGMARLAEVCPRVALLDLGLPGMDGYEVARRMRAQPQGKHTFLAALTGYGGEDIKQRTAAAGFDIHLTKPVDLTALSTLLDGLAPR